ncbi:MAG: NAD(P)H-hydrate epimerase, partial [Gammaproteobacteria bacterium]|nr:NAD(P)H-hydrate epimerase [Gammaproteobacteria bacterium]
MQPFPQELYNAAQSRELDRRAMEEQGIPAAELMRRAGEAAWRVLRGRWPQVRHIAVVAGAGNNAGDGYVVAAGALRDRRQVTVVNVGDATRLSGAAADARKQYLEAGGREQVFSGASPAAEVLVDALLGTGLDRPLQGDWAEAVRVMNACGKPVLALDIPSGLNADTGAIMGVAVHAAATVT